MGFTLIAQCIDKRAGLNPDLEKLDRPMIYEFNTEYLVFACPTVSFFEDKIVGL